MAIDKDKSPLSKVRLLGQSLSPYRKSIGLLLVVLLATSVLECIGVTLIIPILNIAINERVEGFGSELLNPILAHLPQQLVLVVVLCIFLGVVVLKNIGSISRYYLSRRLTWRLRLVWLNKIFEQYMYVPYAQMHDAKLGHLMNDLIDETNRAAICIGQLVELVAKIVFFTALIATLFLIQWQVTLGFLALAGLIVVLLRKTGARYAQSTGTHLIQLRQNLNSAAAEPIGALKQIKLFGLEEHFSQIIAGWGERLCAVQLRFDIVRYIPASFSDSIVATLLVAGILYVTLGMGITLSTVLPLVAVFIIVGQRLISSGIDIVAVYLDINNWFPSLALTQKLIHEKTEQDNRKSGMPFDGLTTDIRVEDLTFSYGDGSPVFKNLSLIIPRGKMTAIVGQSGIGKSTIVDLLTRLYEPDEGRIVANGRPLVEWNLVDWRRHVGVVSQDPVVFNATLWENIALGSPGCSHEEVIRAARMAHAEEFIIEQPKGYDTIIGERGIKLSGGQRQRLAIARALVREPDLLIFDEATSALDAESERLVQQAIEEVGKTRTLVVVAHRLSTIEKADVVYDLSRIACATEP
ncbi:MAG: Lipid A export ATP-binding/permease protein MsbA [Nitrosomonadaceae bacterium]|nr:Lipid A export ATP-binding/permease protein MsbA [Nitrosomonadaceae bacterium]